MLVRGVVEGAVRERGAIGSIFWVVLSGALYGLSFPPAAVRPLAWVALAPALVVIGRASGRGALFGGALLAWVGACFTVYWLPLAAVHYYGQSIYFGALLFSVVSLTMVVPYVALWTWFHRRVASSWRFWTPVLSAAAFVAAEYWRSRILGGNPWAVFGYTQQSSSLVAQVADTTGIYGVSFVLLLVNATIAEVVRRRDSVWFTVPVAAAVVGCVLVYGVWSRAAVDTTRAMYRVAVVQVDLDLGAQWRQEFHGRNLELYLSATRKTLAEHPDLVVWPETAMTFWVDKESDYRASIASYFQGYDAQLLSGAARFEGQASPRFFNSAFLLTARGEILDHYDKEKLLPFTERFPFGSEVLRRDFGRVREFEIGADTDPVETAVGAVGIVICNEALYPQVARHRVLDGAEVLANLSNDTWVGDRGYSQMAFDMASYRAVENRRYLIRASTSGPSAIVDSRGTVQSQTGLFQLDTLVAAVSPSSMRSVYSRLGDLFAHICSTTVVVALLFMRRR